MHLKSIARFAAVAALVVGLAAQRSQAVAGATPSPLLGILQSELQRNFTGLKNEAVPPYFLAYTVHDTKSASLDASFGALRRSDETHERVASVEVRVGDYALDNTHPLRGDAGNGSRLGLTPIPLTDDDAPIRQALWRATDRSFKQATQALTRAKTNVSAKIK